MLSKLIRGGPGHPLHPPLTDLTIGMYSLAAALGVIGAVGGVREAAAKAMWLALVGGIISTALTATTGFIEWLTLEWGTPLWRTATYHMILMLTATVLFALAIWLQLPGYQKGLVTGGGLILTLAGFLVLTVGGWLGGTIVFVHGMRVLNLPELPTAEAIRPGGGHKEQIGSRNTIG
jgi:uncharacterized membrane protein